MEFMQWLGENEVPFAIVFTKSRQTQLKRSQTYNSSLLRGIALEQWEEASTDFRTSAVDKRGRTELLNISTNYADCRLKPRSKDILKQLPYQGKHFLRLLNPFSPLFV